MTQRLLPGSVLALPDQAVQRLIKLDNGDAALLYLHLLRRNGLEGLPWPVERKQAALLRPCRSHPRARPSGVRPGGHHHRPQRQGLHLPRPVRRGGAAAGQEAHRQ